MKKVVRDSEAAGIADQLRRAFDGSAWHGPAVLELLADVDAATAAARPIAGVHSIWELLLHIAVWDNAGMVRLTGKKWQPTGLANFPAVPAHFAPDEGQFSPDGKWIAFRSFESSQPEIYVAPFQTTGRTLLVSAGGGSQPRWRRDGSELFYIRADGTLMVVPILRSAGQDLEVGPATPLFRTHLANVSSPKPQYAVSQDGQRFLMAVAVDATSAPITVVQNWTASLPK